MAELLKLAGPDDAGTHVILFHGLNGSTDRTWGKVGTEVCWPAWLADDIDGLAVWACQYSAAGSLWSGKQNMALTDLADVLLHKLIHEERLAAGSVALVGYSLGGLVAKSALRAADDLKTDFRASSFFGRVERLATIASPHFGSRWANWAHGVPGTRPTRLARSLRAGDPALMNLNKWFRSWNALRPDRTLVILEGADFVLPAQVVTADSANPGITREINTDANHTNIVRIRSRDDIVYQGLKRFLQEMVASKMRIAASVAAGGLAHSATPRPDSDRAGVIVGGARLYEAEGPSTLVFDHVPGLSPSHRDASSSPSALIDAAVEERLLRLRRARFVPTFARDERVRAFAEQLMHGELKGGSDTVRRDALAWVARLLTHADTISTAEEALNASEHLGSSDLAIVARAFMEALKDAEAGIEIAVSVDKPFARSAALLIASRDSDSAGALNWFNGSGLRPEDFDREGQFVLLSTFLQEGRWEAALKLAELARELGDATPQALMVAGLARLSVTFPVELRQAATQIPMHPRTVPLASDDTSMEHRREAVSLFEAYAAAARELGCNGPAETAEDLALWLRLRDSETAEVALKELRESTRDETLTLRRFTLLLDYGVDLDLELVEEAIQREEDLSQGNSAVAATARFAFAFTRGTPAEAAGYLREHRDGLARHLDPAMLGVTEVELLARSGRKEEAAARLADIPEDSIDPAIRSRAAAFVSNEQDGDLDSSGVVARYEAHPSLATLIAAVDATLGAEDWESARKYSQALFSQTRDLAALIKLIRALHGQFDPKAIAATLRMHPDLREQSDELQLHWAWSLFREGDLDGAREALDRAGADELNTMTLRVSIAIASGRWNELHEIVEQVYVTRASQRVDSLLQAAQLARNLASDRAVPLARAAAERAPDDAHALLGAYGIAVSSGWEDDPEVGGWLQRAISLSGEQGPIQSFSLDELVEKQPAWQSHEKQVAGRILAGETPLFLAAKQLNVTLTQLLLVGALSNGNEPDARRRTVIPVRSGGEKVTPKDLRRVALDPSTIFVLLIAGVLSQVLSALDHVVIPHDTLVLLFEERQKLPFHQPSRVREARRIRDLLADGKIGRASLSVPLPAALSTEVGIELAELIAEAAARNSPGADHFVVRAPPIYRPGSLNHEVADVSEYSSLFCSGADLVASLSGMSAISSEEEVRARALLARSEEAEVVARQIHPHATLYFDGLSLGQIYQAGLLDRLADEGFTVFVSARALEEHRQLVTYDRRAAEVDALIGEAQAVLESALREGRATLGANLREPGDEERSHPSRQLFELTHLVDAIAIDDRALNRFDNAEAEGRLVPVISTFELLDSLVEGGRFDKGLRVQALSRLRRANLSFLPVEAEELNSLLATASQVRDGILVETAELRVLRENIQASAAAQLLQMPAEGSWPLSLLRAVREAMRAQWDESISDELAIARTEWLLSLHDLRPWAHRMPGDFDEERVASLFANPLLLSITPAIERTPAAGRFDHWVNATLLPRLAQAEPKTYRALVAAAERFVEARSQADEERVDV